MKANFQRFSVSNETADAWWLMLKDVHITDARDAVVAIAKQRALNESDQPPSPAEVLTRTAKAEKMRVATATREIFESDGNRFLRITTRSNAKAQPEVRVYNLCTLAEEQKRDLEEYAAGNMRVYYEVARGRAYLYRPIESTPVRGYRLINEVRVPFGREGREPHAL